MRVDRKRLKRLLEPSPWVTFFPDYADTLAQADDGITALSARADLAEQLDLLRHRFYDSVPHLPPTLIDQTDTALQGAADLLRKAQIAPEDTTAAKALLAKAEVLLSTGKDDPSFSNVLAKRVAQLQQDFKPYVDSSAYKKISKRLPGTIGVLQANTWTDPTKIAPEDYRFLDIQSSKLLVILDYVQVWQNNANDDFRNRLTAREDELLKNFDVDFWEGLRSARLLVQEMHCDLYPADLKAELEAQPPAVSIEMDQAAARQNQAVELSVYFHREAFNRAAAREEWTPRWEFHEQLKEKWWSVWHYFPEAGDSQVGVYFEDANGRQIQTEGRKLVVERTVQVKPDTSGQAKERLKTELLRTGIALFAAVLALVAGARDQLLKLDVLPGLIAVFSAGFAADTIKNIITQAPAVKR